MVLSASPMAQIVSCESVRLETGVSWVEKTRGQKVLVILIDLR